MPRESDIHQQVCEYLKLQHPSVIFRTDFAAGIKMTMGQAVKHKRLQSGRAFPDLFIAEPRGMTAGLFLELKKPGGRGILKDGTPSPTDQHMQEQLEMLQRLRDRGYCAVLAVGFDKARETIDNYLNQEPIKKT